MVPALGTACFDQPAGQTGAPKIGELLAHPKMPLAASGFVPPMHFSLPGSLGS
jgi:hypothetical protein